MSEVSSLEKAPTRYYPQHKQRNSTVLYRTYTSMCACIIKGNLEVKLPGKLQKFKKSRVEKNIAEYRGAVHSRDE